VHSFIWLATCWTFWNAMNEPCPENMLDSEWQFRTTMESLQQSCGEDTNNLNLLCHFIHILKMAMVHFYIRQFKSYTDCRDCA
jgi:hypothetical protein